MSDVDKMCWHFIHNHNDYVLNDDLIFHVGDFGYYGYADFLNGNHLFMCNKSARYQGLEQSPGFVLIPEPLSGWKQAGVRWRLPEGSQGRKKGVNTATSH